MTNQIQPGQFVNLSFYPHNNHALKQQMGYVLQVNGEQIDFYSVQYGDIIQFNCEDVEKNEPVYIGLKKKAILELLREEYLYLSMPGNGGLLDSTLDTVDAEFSYLSERKMKHYLNVSNFSNIQVAYTYSEAHIVECKVAFANPIIHLDENKFSTIDAAKALYMCIEKQYSGKSEEKYHALINWVNEKHLYEKETVIIESINYSPLQETISNTGVFNYTILHWTMDMRQVSLGLMKQLAERLMTAFVDYEININLAAEQAFLQYPMLVGEINEV